MNSLLQKCGLIQENGLLQKGGLLQESGLFHKGALQSIEWAYVNIQLYNPVQLWASSIVLYFPKVLKKNLQLLLGSCQVQNHKRR